MISRDEVHLYLVFKCKTEGCDTIHMVKYLGVKGRIPENVPISVVSPFILECPKCKNPYNFWMKDLVQVERPEAPPSGFRDSV